MKITVYSLTWDCSNANERIGTRVFATQAECNELMLEWVRSYGIEVDSVDALKSDAVIAVMAEKEIEFITCEHVIEIPVVPS
jgi:hypothetical protein